MKKLKAVSLYVMAVFYVFAGVRHFTSPDFYMQIMPPFLPEPLLLVYISGLAEIALGAALFFKRVRVVAAWGVIALLLAVFPANIYMWTANVAPGGTTLPTWFHYVRFLLQGVLIYWAWMFTKNSTSNVDPS